MRRYLGLWFFYTLFFCSASFSQPLNLKSAVLFALDHSPILDSAKKTLWVREREAGNAFAKLLPSLDLTSSHGLQNNIPIAANGSLFTPNSSAPWYSAINLGLTETLYDNGISLTNKSIADIQKEVAALNFERARANLALDVSNEFYKFSLSHILLAVREQQRVTLDKQFQTLTSQYHQGFKTKSDFLRLKTQVQRAEIDRNAAQNSLELSKTELRKLLGVSTQKEDPPEFDPWIVEKEVKSDTLFPSQKPDLSISYNSKIAKLQNEINDKNASFAVRSYWPQVFVTGGITYSNLNYLNSNLPFSATNLLSWNALLTIQFNIWDFGTRRRNVEIAHYNQEIQDNTQTQLILETDAQIKSLMIDISRVRSNFGLSQELLSLEEETYENLVVQYREGKVTYLDLITSLNSFLDAKLKYYSFYFEALQNSAKYKYFEGTLYETLTQ